MKLYASQHQSFSDVSSNSDASQPQNGDYHHHPNHPADPNLSPQYRTWYGRTNNRN